MFIAVGRPELMSLSILDTEDYSVDDCTLAEVKGFLQMNIPISGVTLVNDKVHIDIKERLSIKQDSGGMFAVCVRGDGQVAIKRNGTKIVLISRNNLQLASNASYAIKSTFLSKNLALFDVHFARKLVDKSAGISAVYAFNLDTKYVTCLELSTTHLSLSAELPALSVKHSNNCLDDNYYFDDKLLTLKY